MSADQKAQQPRARRQQAATDTPAERPERMKLADLEQFVATALTKEGVTDVVPAEIAKHGDPILAAGRLSGYTPARYGKGRWISPAVVKRIAKIVADTAK